MNILAIKILIALALLGGAVFGFEHWKHGIEDAADQRGYDRADKMWKIKEAEVAKQVEDQKATDAAEAKRREDALRKQYDDAQVARAKENEDAKKKLESHVAAALAGAERLSFGTDRTCGAVRDQAAPADPAAAGGTEDEARAYVLPGVAATIFRIASDSAAAMRDYNRVLDLYDKAMTTCNAN